MNSPAHATRKLLTTTLSLLAGVFLAPQAWATDPIAVWSGASSAYNFNNLTRTVTVGGNRVAYSLSNIASGYATVAADGSYIQIANQDQKKGVLLSASGADGKLGFSSGMTVIMKCSSLPTNLGSNRALITVLDGGSYKNGDNGAKWGIGHNNCSGTLIGDGQGIGNSIARAFSASCTIALTVANNGAMIAYTDGTEKLKKSNVNMDVSTMTGLTLGGLDKDGSGMFYAQNNMHIEGIALFGSVLSRSEIAAYTFPGSEDGYLATLTANTDWANVSWANGNSSSQITAADGVKISGSEYTTTISADTTVSAQSIAIEGPLTISGNVTINSDLAVGGAVTVAAGATLNVSGAFSCASASVASGGSLNLSPVAPLSLASTISGAGNVALNSGTVSLLTNTGRITAPLSVASGATLKLYTGQYEAFGGDGANVNSQTVSIAGTLDLNGNRGSCYKLTLAGGTITNSGGDIGNNERQTKELYLTANSTVNASNAFGLLGSQHAATTLSLGDYTLTKTGPDEFLLCETTVSGNDGSKIVVTSGTLLVTPGSGKAVSENTSTIGVPVEVQSGANITVNNNSTFNGEIGGAGTVKTGATGLSPTFAKLDFTSGLTVSCPATLKDGAVIKVGSSNVSFTGVVTTSGALNIDGSGLGSASSPVTISGAEGSNFTSATLHLINSSGWAITGVTATQITLTSGFEAAIGMTGYPTLAAAIAAADDSAGTVKLLKDYLQITADGEAAYTLDLNGHAVASTVILTNATIVNSGTVDCCVLLNDTNTASYQTSLAAGESIIVAKGADASLVTGLLCGVLPSYKVSDDNIVAFYPVKNDDTSVYYAQPAAALNNATSGQTVSLLADYNASSVPLTVPANITLNVGAYTLTCSTLTVNGTVTVASAGSLAYTAVAGAATGEVIYDGKMPDTPSGATTWTNSVWLGTVTIKNKQDNSLNVALENYGNRDSKIKLTNVGGYLNTGSPECVINAEVILDNGSSNNGLTIRNGNSHNDTERRTVIRKLSGTGTLYSNTGTTPMVVVKDATGFTGNVKIDLNGGSGPMFVFSSGDVPTHPVDNGRVYICSGSGVTFASGTTWYVGKGLHIVGSFAGCPGAISGKVKVESTATLDVSAAQLNVTGDAAFAAGATIKVAAEPTAGTPATVANLTGSSLAEGTVLEMVNVKVGEETLSGTFVAAVSNSKIVVRPMASDDVIAIAVSGTTTGGDIAVSGTLPYALTGVGGLSVSSFTLGADGVFIIDPPRTPLNVTAAPSFTSGGKIKLADCYKTVTCGKFILMTYTGNATKTANTSFADYVDETSFGNGNTVEYTVTEDTAPDGTKKQLVLKVGGWDTNARAITWQPMGDSITEGIPRNGTAGTPNYRIPTAQRLEAVGYKVTTKGFREISCNDANGNTGASEHRFHDGISAQRIYTGSTNGSLRGGFMEGLEAHLEQAGETDVITLKIGTNDSLGGENANNMFEGWSNIISRIIQNRPRTKIIVTSILPLVDQTKNAQATAYNTLISEMVAKTPAQGGFPANQVFFVDQYTNIPQDQGYFLTEHNDYVHPNWLGHQKMADVWFVGITNALDKTLSATYTAKTTTTAETNVPAANRKGFVKLATFDQYKAKLGTWSASPYTYLRDGATDMKLAKIAYYVERSTTASPDTYFVWVDMDAWADTPTLANMGMATNFQVNKVVNNLHIYSNSTAIHGVDPETDGVTGTLLFSYKGCAAAGGLSGVPATAFDMDWNDSLSDANYGIMRVSRIFSDKTTTTHRLAAGETLFCFNGYNNTTIKNVLGIGDFAVHCKQSEGNSSMGTLTMNWISPSSEHTYMTSQYLDGGAIEIWGVPAEISYEVSSDTELATLIAASIADGTYVEGKMDVTVTLSDNAVLTLPAAANWNNLVVTGTGSIAATDAEALPDYLTLTDGVTLTVNAVVGDPETQTVEKTVVEKYICDSASNISANFSVSLSYSSGASATPNKVTEALTTSNNVGDYRFYWDSALNAIVLQYVYAYERQCLPEIMTFGTDSTSDDTAGVHVLQTRAELAFPGMTLDVINDNYCVRARSTGGYMDKKGTVAPGLNKCVFRDDDGNITAIRYEMQFFDIASAKAYLKCVTVKLTQGDDGVYAQAVKGRYYEYAVATFAGFGARFQADQAADDTFALGTDQSVATTTTENGYGVYALTISRKTRLAEGVTAYYPFNSGSTFTGYKWSDGALVADSALVFSSTGSIGASGYGNNPLFSSGNFALNGGGSGCYVNSKDAEYAFPHDSSGGSNWTVSFWAKRNNSTTIPVLYYYGALTGIDSTIPSPGENVNGGLGVWVNSDSNVTAKVSLKTGDSAFTTYTLATSGADNYAWADTLAAWNNIMLVRNGTTLTLYVNGASAANAEIAEGAYFVAPDSAKLTLSKSEAMGPQNGLEDLCFWSRALTSTEITELNYRAKTSRSGTATFARPLDVIGNFDYDVNSETITFSTSASDEAAFEDLVWSDGTTTYSYDGIKPAIGSGTTLNVTLTEGATVMLPDSAITVGALNVTGTGTLVFQSGSLVNGALSTAEGVTVQVEGVSTEKWLAAKGVPFPHLLGTGSWTVSSFSDVAAADDNGISIAHETVGTSHYIVYTTTSTKGGSISVNFPGGYNKASNKQENRVSDNGSYSGLVHGAHEVVGSRWNDIPTTNTASSNNLVYVFTDSETVLENSGISLSLSGIANGYDVNKNSFTGDRIIYGYLDDGSQMTLTLGNIPFEKYRVIVYTSTDSDNLCFSAKTINNVSYTAVLQDTVNFTTEGTGVWGDCDSRDSLVEGVNYLVSGVITGTGTATITSARNGNGRGCISAIQIVEVGEKAYATKKLTTTIAAGSPTEAPVWTHDGTDVTCATANLPCIAGGIDLVMNVNDDTSVHFPATLVINTLTLNVAEGKTLKIYGQGVTATTIKKTGDGTVWYPPSLLSASDATSAGEIHVNGEEGGEITDAAVQTTLRGTSTSSKTVYFHGLGGETPTGVTLNYGVAVNATIYSHFVFTNGTHALTYGQGETGHDFGANATQANPTILVTDGTTLNFTAKDLSAWSGTYNDDGIIRVNDGGTLKFLQNESGSFYYRQQLYIEPGATVDFSAFANDIYNKAPFRMQGGNGENCFQIYVPDAAAGNQKVATITSVYDANGNSRYLRLHTDDTKGIGVYVGANATLEMNCRIESADQSEPITKYGAGTLKLLKSCLGYGGTFTVAVGTVELGEDVVIGGNVAVPAGSTLVLNGGSVKGTISGAGTVSYKSGNYTPTNLGSFTGTVSIDGATVKLQSGYTGAVVVNSGTLNIPVDGDVYVDQGLALPSNFTFGANSSGHVYFVCSQYGLQVLGEANKTIGEVRGIGFNAQGVEWNGSANDGLWATDTNWKPARVPTASTVAKINQDAEITLAKNDTFGYILIGNNSKVQFSGKTDLMTGGTPGTINVASGSTICFVAPQTRDTTMYLGNDLVGDGNVEISGENTSVVFMNGADLNTAGTVAINGGAHLYFYVGSKMVTSGAVTVNDASDIGFDLGAALEATGTITLNDTAQVLFESTTAWNGTPIVIGPEASVEVKTGATLTSTSVSGTGTLKMIGWTGTAKTTTVPTLPSGITDASAWQGTVWLVGYTLNTTQPAGVGNGVNVDFYGNASSTLKLSGVEGFFTTDAWSSSNHSWACKTGTIEIEDTTLTMDTQTTPFNGFTQINGYGDVTINLGRLTGSGTLTSHNTPSVAGGTQLLTFSDVSEFTGKLAWNYRLLGWNAGTLNIGTGSTVDLSKLKGASLELSGGTVSGEVPANVTSLTVSSDYLLTFADSFAGTVNVASGATLTLSDVLDGATLASTSAGTLVIPAGTEGKLIKTSASAVPGTVNYAGGASANAQVLGGYVVVLPAGIVVEDGYIVVSNEQSLVVATGLADLPIKVKAGGSIVLSEAAYPGGAISTSDIVWEGTFDATKLTVQHFDGTTATKDVEATYADGVTSVGYVPQIDGNATMIDMTFTNTCMLAHCDEGLAELLEPAQRRFKFDKWDKPATTNASYNNNLNDKSTAIHMKWHPYLWDSSAVAGYLAEKSANTTFAIVGTMPTTTNTVFCHIGSSRVTNDAEGNWGKGNGGMIIYTTGKRDEVVIAAHEATNIFPITTMTVPNSDKARHSYVITKKSTVTDTYSNMVFTIYIDGIKWKTVPMEYAAFNKAHGGIQVGSDFGGTFKDLYNAGKSVREGGIAQVPDDASDADGGLVNCIRIYDRILTEKEAKQYAREDQYPYVSPKGSATRTVTSATEDTTWVQEGKWTITPVSEEEYQADKPVAQTEINIIGNAAATLQIPYTAGLENPTPTEYDTLNVSGSAEVTISTADKSGGQQHFYISGLTQLHAPLRVKNMAVRMFTAPVAIYEGGSLTFDFSDFTDVTEFEAFVQAVNSDIDSTSMLPLTGMTELQDAKKVRVVPPNFTSGANKRFELKFDDTNKAYTLYMYDADVDHKTWEIHDGTMQVSLGMKETDTVLVNTNAALDVYGIFKSPNMLYLNGGILFNSSTNMPATIQQYPNITLLADSYVEAGEGHDFASTPEGGEMAYGFTMNGHKLYKIGEGKFTIVSPMFDSGSLIVSNGTLAITGSMALHDGAVLTNMVFGTLEVGTGVTLSNAVLGGSGAVTGAMTLTKSTAANAAPAKFIFTGIRKLDGQNVALDMTGGTLNVNANETVYVDFADGMKGPAKTGENYILIKADWSTQMPEGNFRMVDSLWPKWRVKKEADGLHLYKRAAMGVVR